MNALMTECIIGLGANLNEPAQQLTQALAQLTAHADIELRVCSRFYTSTPMGPHAQPDYVNAVAIIGTALAPLELLDALQHIEASQGRERTLRWGPRTLDLDILFYGQLNIDSDRLTIPHPGVLEREFVIVPLAEIAPDFMLPNQITAAQFAQAIDLKGLRPLANG